MAMMYAFIVLLYLMLQRNKKFRTPRLRPSCGLSCHRKSIAVFVLGPTMISVSLSQPSKAWAQISSSKSLQTILRRFLQSLKAYGGMNFTFSGKKISSTPQRTKAYCQMCSSSFGNSMCRRLIHPSNRKPPMKVTASGNLTEVISVWPLKRFLRPGSRAFWLGLQE